MAVSTARTGVRAFARPSRSGRSFPNELPAGKRIPNEVKRYTERRPRKPDPVFEPRVATCIEECAWETPDFGWRFPEGAYWRICPKYVVSWLHHKFLSLFNDVASVNRIGALEECDLFLLRLDLLRFEDEITEERHKDYERIPGLLADDLVTFLLPGRETWGWTDGADA